MVTVQHPRAFPFRVAANLSIDYLRKARTRRCELSVELLQERKQPVWPPSPRTPSTLSNVIQLEAAMQSSRSSADARYDATDWMGKHINKFGQRPQNSRRACDGKCDRQSAALLAQTPADGGHWTCQTGVRSWRLLRAAGGSMHQRSVGDDRNPFAPTIKRPARDLEWMVHDECVDQPPFDRLPTDEGLHRAPILPEHPTPTRAPSMYRSSLTWFRSLGPPSRLMIRTMDCASWQLSPLSAVHDGLPVS